MFIGVKKIKRADFKKKTIIFFFIPVYLKIKNNSLQIKKLFGITFYKEKRNHNSNKQFYDNNSIGCNINDNNVTDILSLIKIPDEQKNIDILLHSLSKNLRELKRFENNIIKKFPDLKKY